MARVSSRGLGAARRRGIKFIDRGRGVYSAFIERPIQRGADKIWAFGAVRVMQDGPQRYRIDRTEAVAGAWMPWEAITSTEYKTRAKAQAAVRAWAKRTGARGAD